MKNYGKRIRASQLKNYVGKKITLVDHDEGKQNGLLFVITYVAKPVVLKKIVSVQNGYPRKIVVSQRGKEVTVNLKQFEGVYEA